MLDAESPENTKIVDDGLSTVLALEGCEALQAKTPNATPQGHPWPASLDEIFSEGLRVRVVKYTDDDDKEERMRWNVAKHDVENNTVRWSTCFQKISVPMSMFKKLGDWKAVRDACENCYGPGKSDTYNKWIRAAKGLTSPVMAELKNHPKIAGKMVFDNYYLVTSSAHLRSKLSDVSAVTALQVFGKYNAGEDKAMTVDAFVSLVCQGMRLFEVWNQLIVKRYGVTATASPAFMRLCTHLCSWAGVNSIVACAQAQMNLHGKSETQQGIPECYQMVRELDRCKAGSLPPPDSCPDEAAVQRRQAAEKAAEAARVKAEADATATAKAAEDSDRMEVESSLLNAETEMFALATPMGSPPSAGTLQARSIESAVKECVDTRLQKLHIADSTEELKIALGPFVAAAPRVFVLVDGITTEKDSFGHMLDVAKIVWDLYAAGTGAGPGGQTKFRVVVMLGSRWDLFDKVAKKKDTLWPRWAKFKAQVETRGWQSRCVHPSDVIVLCPQEDQGREPTVVKVDLCKADLASEGVRQTCSDAACQWRVKADLASHEPQTGEDNIGADDRIDLLGAMMAEEEEADAEQAEIQGASDVSVDASKDLKKIEGKLWPYGRTRAHYTKVLDAVGASSKASLAVIVSSTAHPAHWVSCLQQSIDTFVFARKWSNHSKQHGLALGKKFLLDDALREITRGAASSTGPTNSLQCLRLIVPDGPQLLEAHECQQGAAWNDGLNRMVPAVVLDAQSAKLCAAEQEQYGLTSMGSGGDRNLVTVKGLAPGAVACTVSALWFDEWAALESFLSLPGNDHR